MFIPKTSEIFLYNYDANSNDVIKILLENPSVTVLEICSDLEHVLNNFKYIKSEVLSQLNIQTNKYNT
jgi:hypothetical protein